MTTLADMTPDERAECVGMWCQGITGCYFLYLGHMPGGTTHDEETGVPMGAFIDPAVQDVIEAPLYHFVKCDNLPRAWQPDGTPPKGEWQTAKVKIIPNENARYDPATNTITGDAIADLEHEPKSAHDIRCWVGEWEKI